MHDYPESIIGEMDDRIGGWMGILYCRYDSNIFCRQLSTAGLHCSVVGCICAFASSSYDLCNRPRTA